MPSDEVALLNDGRYKSFIATLEKVLKQFEYSSEWADLITNLVKVKKAIESYPKFQSIPKRITLSKRLAQCLHPALPSGVHLKTLEVYETIFRMIGKRNLQRDIILYSCGLFPLLPAAALPVKPVLLTLYETYFLPLGEALNPILTGFFLGLFPALEEGADYYDRIHALLDSLSNRIDKFYFYTCIWSAIHLVAAARHSALTFTLNHFDKRKSMEDQLYLMGSSVETMVSAVCTCLQDREQPLVQRSILDFLLVCLPMHNKQLTKIDMMKIITVSLHILLKRDMSLNRRIYAWFLGTEQIPADNTSQQQQQQQTNEIHSSTTSLAVTNDPFDSSSYFIQYTQENLIQSLLHALETISLSTISIIKSLPTTPNENNNSLTSISESMPSTWTLTKLIRVLIIIVDKPDVGPNILESILMSYLSIVYQQVYLPTQQLTTLNLQQENTRSETLKTLNMLLDTFEPYFIWEFLTKNFDIIITDQHDQLYITGGITIEQLCGIINMLLDIASLESSTDIRSEHLPEMLYRLIKTMNNNISKFTADQITLCIEILLKILKKVVPTNTAHRLSIFRRSTSDDLASISEQKQTITENRFNDNLTSTETEHDNDDDDDADETIFFNENEYSTDIYNKLTRTNSTGQLQNPDITNEQESTHEIERLLRHMVRKVEKQIYKLNNENKKLDTTITPATTTTILTKTMLQSMNHLEKSITLYKIFFHRFIITFLIDTNQISMNEKFQNIYSITQKKTNENIRALFNHYHQQNELQLRLNENVDHYKRAFDDCCKLLIEFCCFPRQSSITDQSKLSKGKTEFDDWSIDLCVLSVCESGHFYIQTTAISVLIELLGYTLYLCNTKSSNTSNEILIGTSLNLPDNISIIPSFNQEQVSLLINETLFFQHITAYLWEHLSDKYERQYNLKSARILSMLHSMLPNCDCEDLICNQLSSTHTHQYENEFIIIDAYKRFFKLWNSTRDISIVTYGHVNKTFERCLLTVIGILNESNNHCLKSIVQQWTCDCFIHRDMYRIFDIILIILLSPDTARISIQKLHPIVHKEYFSNRQINSNDQIAMNTNYQAQESIISTDTDDMSVGDINEITFSVLIDDDGGGGGEDEVDNDDDDDDDGDYDDDDGGEQEESDEEKRICAISCTDTGEVVYHLKQSSPQPMKSNTIKPPTTLSLSQPSLSNSRSVSPITTTSSLSKSVKRRAPTMPTVFSRNNSGIESNSTKSSNNNIQRMYTSLHEETSNETDSLTDTQLINTTINSTINNNTRRPHSVGPIPHAVTLDGISDPSISPLKSLNESETIPMNNNSTKKSDLIDRSRKIDIHLAYFLLYSQPYDYNRVTFALNIIESLIDLIPQQLIHTLLITTNQQSSPINMHNTRLHELSLRHRRAIEGKNFYSYVDNLLNNQHQSYLYTLINILLIYTRSYYSKSFEHRLNVHDMQGNRKVHIRSLTLLKRICHDISYICMENIHTNLQLINYIYDLFQKLSFQKTILHLFNTIIEKINHKTRLIKSKTLTKTIYDYNIEPIYNELTRQYLRELVELLEEIILLENILQYYQHRADLNSNQTPIQTFASNILASITSNNINLKTTEYSNLSLFQFRHNSDIDFINLITKNTQMNSTTNPLRYIDNQPIVNQSLFLSSILQYLKQIDFIENHRHIISLVVRILPHCGSSLKSISSLVIEQICRNLCFVVQTHNQQQQQQQQGNKIRFKQLPYFDVMEYIVHLIERLSYICNYCILGNALGYEQFSTQTLSPQHWMKTITINERDLSDARQSILNQLPSILSSILFIWKTISEQFLFDNTIDQSILTTLPIHSSTNHLWPVYNVRQIRQTILNFLSTLTKSNGVSFISAVAQCWGERKRQLRTQQKVPPTQSTVDTLSRTTILTMPRDNLGETQALIDIVMNINGYTINDMIPNMNELIRNQLTARDKKKQNYDVWCLQFLLAYLQHEKCASIDCWPTLAFMFKECLAQSISPPATFLMIRILSFYIKQSSSLVERRDLKDLQDITMRVLDNCNTIVASSLEQTTWLRKNLQVRVAQPDIQSTKSGSTSNQTTPIGTNSSNGPETIPGDDPADFDGVTQAINTSDLTINGNYSFLALSVLAEHAATLLDIVYNRTDEKDRVVIPFLQNLVTNVMPYVRTHVSSNAPSYRSASALLMNISQYSYTRKAWKKEAFEQLFDVAFFQLDIIALRSWKIIVDNMITNERPTSFRDVMTKINTVQTGLFVSKEHEYEQRAMLVKRFAFVIYASEKDQYNRQLPEILERIADLLKLPQAPILHTQMFLFLRVLLLRISTKNLLSLWPILMAELIQVLLQLEQDLSSDLEGETKSHVQRMVTNDLATTNVTSSNPALKMYLYACKLLDVLLAMPYSELHHFQLFRSAFVTDEDTNDRKPPMDTFIAFSIRLCKLLERKLQSIPASIRDRLPVIKTSTRPLLRLRTITNIIELYPFFNCLTRMHTYDHHHYQHSLPTHTNTFNKQISLSKTKDSSKKKSKSLIHTSSYRKSESSTMNSIKEETMSEIETSVLEDFVESWI
ncbi:unnamed protein product [Adineta steineri]|uniref:Dopey-like protein n=1 Tax=Adineta steineri TaxID=433720 RepID=A0A814CSL3_9BILA|nr:unnamed protein product [Adineta steineri]